jgi:hypothetical protein
MINVTILKNCNSYIVGFCVNGHAGYADSGEDIVCSAVSALTISVINSIETLTDVAFHVDSNQKNGDIEFILEDEPEHDTELILKVFEIGISGIYESYNDYICLTFKEV